MPNNELTEESHQLQARHDGVDLFFSNSFLGVLEQQC